MPRTCNAMVSSRCVKTSFGPLTHHRRVTCGRRPTQRVPDGGQFVSRKGFTPDPRTEQDHIVDALLHGSISHLRDGVASRPQERKPNPTPEPKADAVAQLTTPPPRSDRATRIARSKTGV